MLTFRWRSASARIFIPTPEGWECSRAIRCGQPRTGVSRSSPSPSCTERATSGSTSTTTERSRKNRMRGIQRNFSVKMEPVVEVEVGGQPVRLKAWFKRASGRTRTARPGLLLGQRCGRQRRCESPPHRRASMAAMIGTDCRKRRFSVSAAFACWKRSVTKGSRRTT